MTALIPTTILAMLASTIAPAGSDFSEHQVALEIDGTKLLDEQIASSAENTLYFVRSDSSKALSETHGVKVVNDEQGAPAILVSLSWVNYAESIYGVRLAARRPGEAAEPVESFECACVDSELTAAIIARLPAALEKLETQPSAADSAPPKPPASNPEPDPPATNAEEDKPAVLGAAGIAGIVAGVGGLGMVGFGASRIAKGETRMLDAEREQVGTIRDYRPQGRAWLGAGVGVAAVGVAMLIIDLTVLRKRRARAVAVVPSFGAGMTGLTAQGRF